MVAVQGDDHLVRLQLGQQLALPVHHLEGDVTGDLGVGGGEEIGEVRPVEIGRGAGGGGAEGLQLGGEGVRKVVTKHPGEQTIY